MIEGSFINGAAPTIGAGQTQVGAANQADKYARSSYETGAGTVTMSWTLTSNIWCIAGVSLKPVVTSARGENAVYRRWRALRYVS